MMTFAAPAASLPASPLIVTGAVMSMSPSRTVRVDLRDLELVGRARLHRDRVATGGRIRLHDGGAQRALPGRPSCRHSPSPTLTSIRSAVVVDGEGRPGRGERAREHRQRQGRERDGTGDEHPAPPRSARPWDETAGCVRDRDATGDGRVDAPDRSLEKIARSGLSEKRVWRRPVGKNDPAGAPQAMGRVTTVKTCSTRAEPRGDPATSQLGA